MALWAPNAPGDPGANGSERYVQRLRIYPHAIRAGNAFYSPERKSLLLGYFFASQTTAVDMLPGVWCSPRCHPTYTMALDWDKIPLPALIDALTAKTRGSVVRADQPGPTGLAQQLVEDPLYFELTV